MITEEMKEEILMLCGTLTYNDGLTAYEITKIIDIILVMNVLIGNY